MHPLIFISLIYLTSSSVCAYNLDTRSAIAKTGPPNSYFGYSVALHRQQGGERNLIIGAPLADANNVKNGGAVYKCNADSRQSSCSQIFLDRFGERRDPTTNEQTESKSGQWLGASVATSPSGSLIACAPRYVDFSVNLKRRQPTGLCYLLKNLSTGEEPVEFAPCKIETEWGHHRIGFCQAGFSSTISGSNYIVGAPGSWYWQGQVYSYDMLTKSTLASNDTGKANDDQYKGYSIVSGKFTPNSDGSDVAVGVPKGNKNLSGLVTILNSKMKVIGNLEGEKLGSYFGYALAALDVNGDGLTDLAVSAPMYTEVSNSLEYEQGRVYIYYQLESGFFTSPKNLNGFRSKSRFGQALASLGDIIKKGCDSLAVGAPYDGDEGRGVVYVYDCDLHGIIDKPIQKIAAEDFNVDLRTFGFSLAGNVDLNEDEYPDLIIGAYESDAAVFLKSRPIINVVHDFTITPQNFSLENRNCKDSRGRDIVCPLKVQFCLGFNGGKFINEKLSFVYNITLDVDHSEPRLSLIEDENLSKRLDLEKNKGLRCHTYKAAVHNDIRDKLNPIQVQINYDLLNNLNSQRSSRDLLPIFNLTTNTHLSKNINILKNCGSDNVCIPDLRLSVTKNMDNYVLGTNNKFVLHVVVHNYGEDAFESMLYLEIPEDINLVQVKPIPEKEKVLYQELSKEKYGVDRIDFNLGNPLPARQKVAFDIEFSAKNELTASRSSYDFTFNLTSSNSESSTTLNDNYLEMKVPLRVDVQLETSGSSYINGEKKPLLHNVTTELRELGEKPIYPVIKHSYFIKNKGPSTVKEMQLTILWPERTEDQKSNLFELIAQPNICLNDITNQAKASCTHLDLNADLEMQNSGCKSNALDSKSPPTSNQPHSHDTYDAAYLKPLRSKRQTISANYEDEICEDRCRKIICTVTDMIANTELTVEILATSHNQTLRDINQADIPVTSYLIARIRRLQYNVDPSFLTPTRINATTEVNLIDLNSLQPVPLWIIILAVCSGLFLLFLIILCLWSCGFFKRLRPPTSYSDTQPLHNEDAYSYRKGNRL